MTIWTPTPRTFDPTPASGTGAVTSQGCASLTHLGVTLLTVHALDDQWDQPAVVYGLLDPARFPGFSAAVAEWSTDGGPELSGPLDTLAVQLPRVDKDGRVNVYHELACLNLQGWDGVALVTEGWANDNNGPRREVRQVMLVSADGEAVTLTHTRHQPLPGLDDGSPGTSSLIAAFLRATLGLPNAPFLPTRDITAWLDQAQSPDPAADLRPLTDASMGDDDAVGACVRLLAHPPARRAALGLPAPVAATTLGTLEPSLRDPDLDIAVTPALRRWLGQDYLYGAHTAYRKGRHAADYFATSTGMYGALDDPGDTYGARALTDVQAWLDTLPASHLAPVLALVLDPQDASLYLIVTAALGVCDDRPMSPRELLQALSADWSVSKRTALKAAASIERLHRRHDTRRHLADAHPTIQRIHRVLTDLADPDALATHLT